MVNFNGYDLKEYFDKILDVRRDILPPRSVHSLEVPGRAGSYLSHVRRESRVIEVDVFMIDRSFESLRSRVREAAAILDVDQPSPLIVEDEPDLVWYAVLMDDTPLEEIIFTGRTTLRFFVPDPYAIGPSESQYITDRYVTEVTQTQEDWAQGTLSNVEASPEGLRLERGGEDLNGSADWTEGQHDQTRIDEDGKLTLDYLIHEPTEASRSEAADGWAGGVNEGVGIDGSDLVMTDFPAWTYTDDMTDYLGTGWDPRINPSQVTQTANTVRLVSTIGEDTAVAIVKETTDDIKSIELLYRLIPRESGDPSGRMVLSLNETWPTDPERWVAFRPEFIPTDERYFWMRMVITRMPTEEDNGEAIVYINGEYHETIEGFGSQLSPRIQFILENEDHGTLNISDVKYTDTVLHEQQTSYPFPLSGQRISPEYDLSSIGEYRGSVVTYDWSRTYTLPLYGEEWEQQIDIEVAVFKNGVWTGYQKVSSGDSIPQLTEGEDLRGVKVRMRYTLKSYDYYMSPLLHNVTLAVEGFFSEYHPSGTWTGPPISLDSVGVASLAQLIYEVETQPGTSVTAEIAIEEDGVMGEWQAVDSGDLPQLIGVDLTNVRLFYRFRLETEDPALSPRVVSAIYSFISAYKREGYRISNGVPLGDIDTADDSYIHWESDGDGVEIYVQVVQEGQEPHPDQWVSVAENGGAIPGVSGDTAGLVLYTRQRLVSDGETSPTLTSMEWVVVEAGEEDLEYEGTAPGYPLFRVEVQQRTDHLRILHIESGQFILIESELQPGDVIEIDNSKSSIKLNGVYRMKYLNIKSRFFQLQKGLNTFEVSPIGVAQVKMSWEERWK